MHPVIQAQLQDFLNTNSKQEFEEYEAFEIYSIHAIENGLMGLNVDPFDVHLNATEFGIDGVSIIVQGELCTDPDQVTSALSFGKNHSIEFHLFQSKTSTHLDYGDAAKFLHAVVDFFNDGKLAQSSQIEDLRNCKDVIYSSLTKKNPNIRCFYCTTGTAEVSDVIEQLKNDNKKCLEEMSLFSDVEISFHGAQSLQNGYRSATNAISASFDFPESITLPDHPSVDEAFIGVVAAKELLKLAVLPATNETEDRVNRAVFYDNIRDFDPQSEINQAILSDLREGSDQSFVFKNNGVTVVAKEISRKSNTYSLEDYQIVNGCQTTNVLFLGKDHIDGVSVPLRLIGTRDADFISTIIVGTNKQNEVREDQFWALLPFMKDLEEYCRAQTEDKQLLIERRENQYREIKVERTRIIKPAELIKAIAATYLGRPNRAARDYRGVRNEFKDQIFQPSHNVELYHLAAMCSYKFDFAIRNKRVDRSRNIYKFYALFAALREFWDGPNLLNSNATEQRKVKQNIDSLLDDEDRWIQHIEKVSSILDDKISEQGLTTREQIRDYIRTDAARSAFIDGAYGEE